MKIIFAGTPEIAIETLATIHESDHELTLVLTNEDKPSGRGKKITKPPVKLFAEHNSIEIKQPPVLKDEDFINFLKSKKADLFVVFAYGHLIPEEILKIFKKGALNIHTSILPKLRGAAPIQRAIINGDKLTGVTFMKMEKGLDTGPIYKQYSIEIKQGETSDSLERKMSKVSSSKVLEVIDSIDKNYFNLVSQDNENASYAPKIIKEESKIDWTMTANDITNLINGLSPSPATYSFLNKERINFYLAETVATESLGPGRIVQATKNNLFVGARDFCVSIKELSRAGKKRQKYESFYNGSKKIFSKENFSS